MTKQEYLESIKDDLRRAKVADISVVEGIELRELMEDSSWSLLKNDIICNLIDLGIIHVQEGEFDIYRLPITSHLRNCLRRANVYYLSEIKKYPVEHWNRIRGMGVAMIKELLDICEKCDVTPFRLSSIQNKMLGVQFTKDQLSKLFYQNVFCAEDLVNISDDDFENLSRYNKSFGVRINKVKEILKKQSGGA